MKLKDYIHSNYNGSQTDFARANKLTKQVVWRMLQKECWYVYDGMLLQAKKVVK